MTISKVLIRLLINTSYDQAGDVFCHISYEKERRNSPSPVFFLTTPDDATLSVTHLLDYTSGALLRTPTSMQQTIHCERA